MLLSKPNPNSISLSRAVSATHSMTKFKDGNITPMTRLEQEPDPGQELREIKLSNRKIRLMQKSGGRGTIYLLFSLVSTLF